MMKDKILMSSNQKVISPTSASFVFLACKKWRVPDTNDKTRTHLDNLQVSLLFRIDEYNYISAILLTYTYNSKDLKAKCKLTHICSQT